MIHYEKTSTPMKCPVCEGRGKVISGFYAEKKSKSRVLTDDCRSCQATGIVFAFKETPMDVSEGFNNPYQYQPPDGVLRTHLENPQPFNPQPMVPPHNPNIGGTWRGLTGGGDISGVFSATNGVSSIQWPEPDDG